jgi:predicted DNA-binding protein (MmcQ/YjbR family)
MNRTEFEELVVEHSGSARERPFEKDQSIVVFRHHGNRKWFAVVMTIPQSRLGLDGNERIDIVNLKCAEELLDSLWQEDGIFPAYHMNKRHWITVALDGRVPTETLLWLLSISRDLTRTRIRVKRNSKR